MAQAPTADQQMLLQQMLQQRGGGTQGQGGGGAGGLGVGAEPAVPQSQTLLPQTLIPQTSQASMLPRSRLEQIMSGRAGERLNQFGYNQLGIGRAITVPETGAVQDDYIMGPGDEVVVSLRGQENSDFRALVDRNGSITLPRLPPISATGRSFGSFRQDLDAAVHRSYVASNASVSIGRVRQISVLVSGEVNSPGPRIVTGLSSVVDALLLSGGVKKTGSLRNVRIQRAGREFVVDLYSVLTSRGSSVNSRLADGDRILVPPLGRTVAVGGLVRQPGIYELPVGQSGISVRTLLSLAGGQEVRGAYRLSVLRVQADGQSVMEPLTGETGSVRDSEILFAQLGADYTGSQATLSGATGLAGPYAIRSGMKLSDVLRAPGALGSAPYTLLGIIERRDPKTLLRSLIAFTPIAVMNRTEDMQLQSDDIIRVISVEEAGLLTFVVKTYLSKLATDQASMRAPLDSDTHALNITDGNYPGIDPNDPSRLRSMAAQVPENSFGMDDVISAPADVQRSDILALLDVAAPGTTLARRQDKTYLRQLAQLAHPADPSLQTGTSTTNPTDTTTDPTLQAGAAAPDGTRPPVPAVTDTRPYDGGNDERDVTGDRADGRAVRDDPAPNYMEQPMKPGSFASNREVKTFGQLSQQLGMDPLVLVNFLINRRVRLEGAVSGPGSYFVGPNATLQDLIQAAGGTTNWADQSGVELITTAVDSQGGRATSSLQNLPLSQSTLASYIVHPRDQFRFKQVYNDVGIGSITVQGEVRFSGSYPVMRGERLSDVLMRAGGLTRTAYPAGTVFLRKSAAAVEHQGYIRAANEIQGQLLSGMSRVGTDKIPAETFTAMQAFVNRLRTQKALGRVSFVADPSVLAAHPELDPLLESGDLVYIPQRPSTVSVLGEVMQPGTYAYQPGMKLEDYISKAGGYAQFSNESMTFIVLPDGTARKVDRSLFNFDPAQLPPGSAIVVPRELAPIDTRQIILDVTGILSQLAVSLASLAVLSRN